MELLHTFANLYTFDAYMPPIIYEHNGNFNTKNRKLEIEIQIQFFSNSGWTELIPLKAIIDTGASHSHISQSVVPKDILCLNKDNKGKVIGATSVADSIIIQNVNLFFPGNANTGLPFIFFFTSLSSANDSLREKAYLDEGKQFYPLLIGHDVLECSELFYNGPSKNYKLTFSR